MNIDDLLREYVAQPVPQGLEARVMRRVRAESRRCQWGWLVPALVAAGLVLGIWMRPMPARHRMSSTKVARENAYSTPIARLPPQTRKRHTVDGARALWRFARKHPEATASLAIEYESTPIVPLQIEAISIEELNKQ
jgi:hypothetical protein